MSVILCKLFIGLALKLTKWQTFKSVVILLKHTVDMRHYVTAVLSDRPNKAFQIMHYLQQLRKMVWKKTVKQHNVKNRRFLSMYSVVGK